MSPSTSTSASTSRSTTKSFTTGGFPLLKATSPLPSAPHSTDSPSNEKATFDANVTSRNGSFSTLASTLTSSTTSTMKKESHHASTSPTHRSTPSPTLSASSDSNKNKSKTMKQKMKHALKSIGTPPPPPIERKVGKDGKVKQEGEAIEELMGYGYGFANPAMGARSSYWSL